MKSGDIVSIFSEADIHVPLAEQTKLVTLDGEFVHSGVYSVHPGETLRQLVERAGGVTTKAYLYGSEFTRESVRSHSKLASTSMCSPCDAHPAIEPRDCRLSSSTAQDLALGCPKQRTGFDLLPCSQDPRYRPNRFDAQAETAAEPAASLT